MNTIQYQKEKIAPSKVVCIGRNYVEHIEELGNEIPENMVVFNKPNSAVTDTLRYFGEATRFEGEICFLMQSGRIAGVGFGLDLTHVDIQNHLKAKGLPWERAKAFDGSAVLSDFVPFEGDISKLRMRLYYNGKLQQFADYDLMMYKPETMIAQIKGFMTLEDGDVIMSGTPKGVGNYRVGDRFVGEVYEGENLLIRGEWVAHEKTI
ncbi:MAG: fumarylacetoacetate hydrolase family protein [Sulfurovum sp.]|nr:fumarylacetoacetate hydrolase family protein [Sulfurovum sp.]